MLHSSRETGTRAADRHDLVTVARAAARAHVAPRLVRRWVHEGLLPVHHANAFGRSRVDPADVERLSVSAVVRSDEADERLWTGGAGSGSTALT